MNKQEQIINEATNDIAVKGVIYKVENPQRQITDMALKTAKELFEEEKEFQQEEYQTLLDDNVISNYDEYCEEVGISKSEVDYIHTSFEDNINHPAIQSSIEGLIEQYSRNVYDLPKDTVIAVPVSKTDSKGAADKSTLIELLNQNLPDGITVIGYEAAGQAEKKDLLIKSTYDKVGEMLDSKAFNDFLEIRASINKYSANNISLIYAQNSDAKAVMGYNAWQKYDRQVQAGEKSIAIWMPMQRELKTEKQVDNYLEKHKNDYANLVSAKQTMMKAIEDKGKYEVFSGYRLGAVFDINQTACTLEHDNYEELLHLERPLDNSMENYESVRISMADAAKFANLSINDTNVSQQDALFNAVYHYADDVMQNSPEKVAGIKSNIPLTGDMHKAETAISTYLICKHIGIECDEQVGMKLAEAFNDKFSEQSITVGRRSMFETAFDRGCRLADEFNKDFDRTYEQEMSKNAVKDDINKKETKSKKDVLVLD